MRYSGMKLLAASIVALAAPATADEVAADQRIAFRLEYVVPAGARCPTETALAELTSAKFRYDVFAEAARATLSVTVRRSGGQLEAVLTARDEQGALQWEETATPRAGCNDLVEDVALMVAARFVTVKDEKPEAWMLLAPPAPPEAPKPPPPSMAVPLPQLRRRADPDEGPLRPPSMFSSAPPPSAPDAPSFRNELSAAFVFGPFDTPNVALGGALQIALLWPRVSLGVEMRGVGDHRGEIAGVPIRTWLLTGVALPCLVIGEHTRICLPISGGVYRITLGNQLKAKNGGIEPFFGAGLRGSYDVALTSRVKLRGYAEVLGAATGSEIEFGRMGAQAADTIWSTPMVLPSIGLGISWEP